MNQEIKRYLISSGVSFVAAFCLAVIPLIDNLTMEGIEKGALIAVLFVGVRAGVKVSLELIAGIIADSKK